MAEAASTGTVCVSTTTDLKTALFGSGKNHTHAPHIPCYPACQAYSLIDALRGSLRDGHAELTRHYNGGEEERVEHLDSWLDEHGVIVDRLVALRDAQDHAEVLAKALDQFFHDNAKHRWEAPVYELRDATAPTLQALGYPKEAGV